VTPHKISAVSFSNTLNINDKKIILLFFTALTPIFVPPLESERLRQRQDLQPYKWFKIPGKAQDCPDF